MCNKLQPRSSAVVRTRVLRALDRILSAGHLELLCARIETEPDLLRVLEDIRPPSLSVRDYARLRREWFDARTAWWRRLPNCADPLDVLRRGILRTIQVAQQHQWPSVVSYWVRGPDCFQVTVDVSERQLTMFVVTPDPVRFHVSNN